MAVCEMCGREGEMVRISLEGSVMDVCQICSKHGKILGKVPIKKTIAVNKVVLPALEEVEERVVLDFGSQLNAAREKKGLKREDFARMLNERESLVERWERGEVNPRLSVAKKIGKLLQISLVEKVKNSGEKLDLGKSKSGEMTLGDMIKIRKR